jgi:predicted metalloprotease
MSFNDNADLDTSQVEGGGGGGGMFSGGGMPGGGIAVGGGAGGILLLIIYLVLNGLGGSGSNSGSQQGQLDQGQVQSGGSQAGDFSRCKTGADANRDAQCRVIGTVNSVQAYWAAALPRYGTTYSPSNTVLYSGSAQSRCGTASNQVGPFYCPLDRKVYIDASFFNELTSRFGADSGALAQEYVVAHEYGHHIQDLLGVLDAAQSDPQGAESGSVRVELMADCLAGVWAKHATETKDAQGDAFLKPLTQQDIQSALSAASAVGDDRIQQKAQGQVNPETWTHGSSAQRQTWFTTGYRSGDLNACDTLHAPTV